MIRRTHPRLPLVALLALLFLGACGLSRPQGEDLDPVMPASMFVEYEVSFCDAQGKDKFAVGYYGTDPLDTLIHLYIVCHQKDTIYRAAYPGEWFLENPDVGTDSAKVARIHAQMRALAEGKLMPPRDSFDLAAAGAQPTFGIDLPGHLMSVLYYSPADHKVHALE